MVWMLRKRRDTGPVSVTPPALTAGTIVVQRAEDLITLDLEAAVFGDLTGTQTINDVLPLGFRATRWVPFSTVGVYGPVRHARTLTAGSIQIFGLQPGDVLRAHVVFFTADPFPEVRI